MEAGQLIDKSAVGVIAVQMKQLLVLYVLCAALLATVVSGGFMGRLLHRDTTTTTTTTTAAPRRPPFFINNHVPTVAAECEAHFKCKKKLTQLAAPRPCVIYCLKRIDCPNNVKVMGKPHECVELDEEQVMAEYEALKAASPKSTSSTVTTEKIMEVAMIDFPCQPGYLPDSRGRCREVW